MFLNTGIEYLENVGLPNEEQTIDYMQTIGPRATFKSGKFDANASIYFQAGKSLDASVSASYFAGNVGFKINDNFKVAAGMEYLSGKDMNDVDTDIKSFAPLFGTNHKFNGWMDYFYVGNPHGNVGLTDIYATVAYSKNKFSAKVIPHIFSAAADIYNGAGVKMDNSLGTEIDITIGYKLSKSIKLNAGHSMMFATESMEVIKGVEGSILNYDTGNSWTWVMFTFKPKLFTHIIPSKEE